QIVDGEETAGDEEEDGGEEQEGCVDVEADGIEEGNAIHRVGDPGDDRLNEMYGGVNLSQGFPDFPAPDAIKEAACAAINADVNQYAVTWGARPLREAVAREFTRRYGVPVVADEQVTVCCGSTEAMVSTMLRS